MIQTITNLIWAAYSSEFGVDEDTHQQFMNLIEIVFGGKTKNKINTLIDATDGNFYFPNTVILTDISSILEP